MHSYPVQGRCSHDTLRDMQSIHDAHRPHSDRSGIHLRIVRLVCSQHTLGTPANGNRSLCIACTADDICDKWLCRPTVLVHFALVEWRIHNSIRLWEGEMKKNKENIQIIKGKAFHSNLSFYLYSNYLGSFPSPSSNVQFYCRWWSPFHTLCIHSRQLCFLVRCNRCMFHGNGDMFRFEHILISGIRPNSVCHLERVDTQDNQ